MGLVAVLALSGACAVSVRVRVGGGDDCLRDFGTSTAASKIETFLAAADALDREVAAMGENLRRACAEALREARGPASTGAPSRAVGDDTEAEPCAALGGWLEAELSTSRGTIRVESPRCVWPRELFTSCVLRCELRYRPEDIDVVTGAEGALSAPQAGPRCRAGCSTLAALEARCERPVVHLEVPDEASGARVERLRRVVEGPLLAVADVALRARRVTDGASRLVAIAPALPDAAATISIDAVDCVARAAETVARDAAMLERIEQAASRVSLMAPRGPVSIAR